MTATCEVWVACVTDASGKSNVNAFDSQGEAENFADWMRAYGFKVYVWEL